MRGGPTSEAAFRLHWRQRRCVAPTLGFLLAIAQSAIAAPLPLRPSHSIQIGGTIAVPVPLPSLHYWFDDFGASVAALGDLDRDGVADLLVGAPTDERGPRDEFLGSVTGRAIVLFLEEDGGVKAVRSLDGSGGPGNVAGPLHDGDRFGAAVAAVGDIDGDGVVDIAVGAPGDDEAATDAGAVYLLFLDTSGDVKSEKKIVPGRHGFSGTLAPNVRFGASIARLGDASTPPTKIAVGAPAYSLVSGAVWVVALDATGDVVSHEELRADDEAISPAVPLGVLFGAAVAGPGDIDGNGALDLLVGAPGHGLPGRVAVGAAWLLLRDGAGGISSSMRISDGSGGFPWQLPSRAYFGFAASALGDIDGDGVGDVAVAAPGEPAIYALLLGDQGAVLDTRRLDGRGSSSLLPGFLGTAVTPLGDLDGNGIAELAIGSDRAYESYPSTTTTTFFCSTSTITTTSTTLGASLVSPMCVSRSVVSQASTRKARDATTQWCSFETGLDKCGRPKGRICGDEHVVVMFLDLEADPANCGNGVVDVGEACDDGNTDGGDCCSADCLVAPSGNECRFDGNPCGTHLCDGGGSCVFVPRIGPCVDYLACVGRGTCIDGACIADGVQAGLCRVEDYSCRACGQPVSAPTEPPSASDALWVLQAAVGTASCLACVCDVDRSYTVTAIDALVVLQRAVDIPGAPLPTCPHR